MIQRRWNIRFLFLSIDGTEFWLSFSDVLRSWEEEHCFISFQHVKLRLNRLNFDKLWMKKCLKKKRFSFRSLPNIFYDSRVHFIILVDNIIDEKLSFMLLFKKILFYLKFLLVYFIFAFFMSFSKWKFSFFTWSFCLQNLFWY